MIEKRKAENFLYSVLMFISIALFVLVCGITLITVTMASILRDQRNLAYGLDSLLLGHPQVFLGLPAAAFLSFIIVIVLRGRFGIIEFEVLGVKFKGVSGPVVLWAFCFLVIVLAILLLW